MGQFFRLFSVPVVFDRRNIKEFRKAQYLNFLLLFVTSVFLFASGWNFLYTDFTSITALQTLMGSLCLYAYYRFRKHGDTVFPAWIVSSVAGIDIMYVIIYARGGLDTYAQVLLYPLLVYSLHSIRTANILYIAFSLAVISTIMFGWNDWNIQHPRSTLFNVFMVLLIGGIIIFYFEYTKEEALDKLSQLTMTDALTGAMNRNAFSEHIEAEMLAFERYGKPLSLVVLDIDHFKLINDNYGHNVGDMVLKEIAALLEERKRACDYLIRWGGEEFVIIMQNTTHSGAESFAKSLLEEIRSHNFSVVKHVTVSAGIASASVGVTGDALFKLADERLYVAKNTGRDRYVSE